MEDRQKIYQVVRDIARQAGDRIRRHFFSSDKINAQPKGPNDFVTRVDRESESLITSTLQQHFPGIPSLAEETKRRPSHRPEYLWVIDPLDGTTNFLQKIPHFGISIALLHRNTPVFGLVYHPLLDETFHAFAGEGSYLNRERIAVSAKGNLSDCVGSTGFPFRSQHQIKAYLAAFRAIFTRSRGMRRCGAAVLDLAYLACGRYDYFWEAYLEPWDFLAGAILIQEAGGTITDFHQQPLGPSPSDVLAAPPQIYHQILPHLQAF